MYFKWVGSKRASIDAVCAALAKRGEPRVHWEPFLGSGRVPFGLRALGWRCPIIASDACGPLVGVHRAVQAEVEGVIRALDSLPWDAVTLPSWPDVYAAERGLFNVAKLAARDLQDHADPEQAARFLFLVGTGFNGLYRENGSGELNTPPGRYVRARPPAPELLREVAATLGTVELFLVDWRACLDGPGRGDTVYLDPPYWPAQAGGFAGYVAGGFGPVVQRELAYRAEALRLGGVHVVASNNDLPDVRALYPAPSWTTEIVMVGRAINSDPTGRKAVPEVLLTGAP